MVRRRRRTPQKRSAKGRTKDEGSPKAASGDGFVFDPPLPTLWSASPVARAQLARSVTSAAAAKRLYDEAMEGFDMYDAAATR